MRQEQFCLKYQEKRAAKRMEAQAAQQTTLKAVALKKRLHSTAEGLPFPTSYQEDFVPWSPAWKAQIDTDCCKREYSLEELVSGFDMRVVAWDGR